MALTREHIESGLVEEKIREAERLDELGVDDGPMHDLCRQVRAYMSNRDSGLC